MSVSKTPYEPMTPLCIVCGEKIPAERARLLKDTCSPEHHQVMKRHRKEIMNTRKCKACYRPSTPEERENFKHWRRSMGQRRAEKGRPPVKRLQQLTDALQSTLVYLRRAKSGMETDLAMVPDRADVNQSERGASIVEAMGELDKKIKEIEALIPVDTSATS